MQIAGYGAQALNKSPSLTVIKGPYRTRKLDFGKLAGASISSSGFVMSRALSHAESRKGGAQGGTEVGLL